MAAATGFASAVDFSRGFARSFDQEFSTENICQRQELDALVTFDPSLASLAHGSVPRIVFNLLSMRTPRLVATEIDATCLEIKNLHSLNDDFHRIDHLTFGVENESAADRNGVMDFLNQILQNLT